jgi:hypothetical protein
MISKFLASTRTAVTELRALVARQAAAILRLLSHLANLGDGGAAPMAIAADAPGGAPPALNPPSLPDAAAKPPPRAEPPPAPAAQAPDCSGGGNLTLDQVRPLLLKALKHCPRCGARGLLRIPLLARIERRALCAHCINKT